MCEMCTYIFVMPVCIHFYVVGNMFKNKFLSSTKNQLGLVGNHTDRALFILYDTLLDVCL